MVTAHVNGDVKKVYNVVKDVGNKVSSIDSTTFTLENIAKMPKIFDSLTETYKPLLSTQVGKMLLTTENTKELMQNPDIQQQFARIYHKKRGSDLLSDVPIVGWIEMLKSGKLPEGISMSEVFAAHDIVKQQGINPFANHPFTDENGIQQIEKGTIDPIWALMTGNSSYQTRNQINFVDGTGRDFWSTLHGKPWRGPRTGNGDNPNEPIHSAWDWNGSSDFGEVIRTKSGLMPSNSLYRSSGGLETSKYQTNPLTNTIKQINTDVKNKITGKSLSFDKKEKLRHVVTDKMGEIMKNVVFNKWNNSLQDKTETITQEFNKLTQAFEATDNNMSEDDVIAWFTSYETSQD